MPRSVAERRKERERERPGAARFNIRVSYFTCTPRILRDPQPSASLLGAFSARPSLVAFRFPFFPIARCSFSSPPLPRNPRPDTPVIFERARRIEFFLIGATSTGSLPRVARTDVVCVYFSFLPRIPCPPPPPGSSRPALFLRGCANSKATVPLSRPSDRRRSARV